MNMLMLPLLFLMPAPCDSLPPQGLEHRLEINLNESEAIRLRRPEQSAQGLAIHDSTMFALYHLGHCVTVDLASGGVVGEFTLEGACGTHCNNASFGTEYAAAGSAFPLLYVSECGGEKRCFVLDMELHGSRHVQTIRFAGSGIAEFCDWCVDRENGHLYAIGKTFDSGVVLKRFPLPRLSAGSEVVLDDCDVLWQSSYPRGFFRITQGSFISGGKMYMPTGDPRRSGLFLHVLSLSDGARTALWDIGAVGLEPEGLCSFGGRLWIMFADGNGRVCSFGVGGL